MDWSMYDARGLLEGGRRLLCLLFCKPEQEEVP